MSKNTFVENFYIGQKHFKVNVAKNVKFGYRNQTNQLVPSKVNTYVLKRSYLSLGTIIV